MAGTLALGAALFWRSKGYLLLVALSAALVLGLKQYGDQQAAASDFLLLTGIFFMDTGIFRWMGAKGALKWLGIRRKTSDEPGAGELFAISGARLLGFGALLVVCAAALCYNAAILF